MNPFRSRCGIFLGILVLMLTPSLRADIGENSKELYKRFGEGRFHKDFIVFEPQPYSVSVILDEKKRSHTEIVARIIDENGERVELESDDPTSRVALSEMDLRNILSRNANGKRWLRTRGTRKATVFVRDDHRVMAVYSPIARTVTFQPFQQGPIRD